MGRGRFVGAVGVTVGTLLPNGRLRLEATPLVMSRGGDASGRTTTGSSLTGGS